MRFKFSRGDWIENCQLAVFIRINPGFARNPLGISAKSGWANASLPDQLLHAPSVNGAPHAGGSSRSKPDFVTLGVNSFTQTVNPADTQRLVYCFRPGDTRFASVFSVKAD